MNLVFEVCQESEMKDMLALAYLVLQACISFFEVFQTKRGAFLLLSCLHIEMPLLE